MAHIALNVKQTTCGLWRPRRLGLHTVLCGQGPDGIAGDPRQDARLWRGGRREGRSLCPSNSASGIVTDRVQIG